MYLKSLILRGFKSFGKKSELSFDRGISVIVGPNGSGKSNIADAVSWVLGEQSPKSLRSSSMDEVIFKNKNEELGIAEVSLVFDNRDKRIPLEFRDIKFTRKVYSKGGSDYYINSSPARLIDIQDIIADTGIGKGLYTIISQGEIDEIALLKPEDRKKVVDEIIGITKHKNRKEKSLTKLQDIAENISRVEDLMFEIKKTMNPLKVEAEKAQRYFEIKNDLKNKELSLFVLQLNELNSNWEKINSEIEKTENAIKEFENKENRLMVSEKDVKKALEDLESKYKKYNDNLTYMEDLRNKLNSHILIIVSKINNFSTLSNLTDSRLYDANNDDSLKNKKGVNIGLLKERLTELKSIIDKFFREIKNQYISVEMVLEIEKNKTNIDNKIEKIIASIDKRDLKNVRYDELGYEIKNEIFQTIKKLSEENIEASRFLNSANKRLIDHITKSINDNKPRLLDYSDLLENKRNDLENIEKEKNKLIIDKNKIENNIFKLNLKKDQIKEKVKDITLMVTDNYDISIEYLQKNYGPCKDRDSTKTIIRDLKSKIKKIGSVNPNARIEYDRIKERYDFLDKEKNDLVESKNDLSNIIIDIDNRIKKLFMENFSNINKNFSKNFKLLFPLGRGELILTGDIEDIDDMGVDLKIDMGNSKLVPLTLLSGGEKALVSIAFLFSVYSLNFSPFYLLDEVDAALDDTNLNRFLNLLRDFAADKQVLLITHQKRTMEIADTIYGVSMQSNGISKIVSVKLNGNEKNN